MIQYDILKDLVDIKTTDEKTLLQDLVEMFFQQTPERLYQIERAIKDKNKEQIARTAHILKASCSYLGIDNMTALCNQLEKWGQDVQSQDILEAQIYLSALEDSFEESVDELNKYLGMVLH